MPRLVFYVSWLLILRACSVNSQDGVTQTLANSFTDDTTGTDADPTEPTVTSQRPRQRPVLLCQLSELLNPDGNYYKVITVCRLAQTYRWAVCVPLALIGNAIAFLGNVKKAGRSSPHFYMTTLAVVDSVALALRESQFQVRSARYGLGQAGCKAQIFFLDLFAIVAAWMVAIMTIERMVVVRFPLKASAFCTWKKAVTATISVTIIAAVFSLHAPFIVHFYQRDEVGRWGECQIDGMVSAELRTYDVWVKNIVQHYVPVVVLFFCNIVIIMSVRAAASLKRDMTGEQGNKDRSQERQVTVMVLLVSVTFLLLSVSSIVVRYVADLTGDPLIRYDCYTICLYSILIAFRSYVVDLNNCINGYIYCLTSSRFRADFARMICPCRYAGRDSKSSKSTTLTGVSMSTISGNYAAKL